MTAVSEHRLGLDRAGVRSTVENRGPAFHTAKDFVGGVRELLSYSLVVLGRKWLG